MVLSRRERAPLTDAARDRADSRPRRLVVAVALAMPWILLGLLEIVLRLAGYGGSCPVFVPAPGHPDYLLTNPEMARRYFASGPFVPTPAIEFFHARRTPRTYRIFFQGESSAQGFPYGHGGMPSRRLEQRLQATFPDRDIEVVNTALTGINSYTLLDQAPEILAQHPDAVLIYTGHNEYYGAFGVGSSQGFGAHRALVRAYLVARRSRVVQLLTSLAGHLTHRSSSDSRAPRTVMELMAGGQRIPLGSRRYQEGLDQFRANLAELLSRYQAHGVPVLIGTLASDERDQPPLAGPDAADTDSAAAYYARAQRLDAAGDMAAARAAYREAKERDPLRFRAPEAMNQIIREEAARHGAIVVETQQAIEAASPGGIPGHALILEHLHPNLDGYFVIANAFYDAMRSRHMIGDWTVPVAAADARRAVAVTPVDSLVAIMRTDRLESGWPFRPLGAERTPMVDTLRPRDLVTTLAQGIVLGQVTWPDAMERLRAAAEQAGNDDIAIHAALALAEEYRYSPDPLLELADLSLRRGRDDDASAYASASLTRQETARGEQIVGTVLLRKGERDAALPHLKQAAALSPGDRRAEGRYVAATELPALEQQRDRSPGDPRTLYDLALAYMLTEQNDKARGALSALQRVAPNYPGASQLVQHLPR